MKNWRLLTRKFVNIEKPPLFSNWGRKHRR